jgi:hypothetical protein
MRPKMQTLREDNSRSSGIDCVFAGMKRWIFVLLAGIVLIAVQPARAESDGLQSAGSFALGGVGVAGTMSAGERALREVLKREDAVVRLEALLPNASPAGKLYALLGLKIRDRAAYERALEKWRTLDAKVETARGCMLSQESFRDLVKEIERGQYDTFLEREWPKEAR